MRPLDAFLGGRWTHLMIAALLVPAGAAPASAALARSSQEDGEPRVLRSRGYAEVLAVAGDEVILYQETESSLLRLTSGRVAGDLLSLIVGVDADGDPIFVPVGTLREEGDTLVLEHRDGTVVVYDPIAGLPEREITGPTDDPEANFQVFWEFLEENGSYFALTGIDWRAMYERFRALVTAQTSEEELFEILSAMVAPLRDGHLLLIAPSLDRAFEGRPPSPSAWMLERQEEVLAAIASRLDGGALEQAAGGLLRYGTIDGAIGYLNILSFDGYTDPPNILAADPLAEEAVFEAAVDEILAEFAPLDALILDIRLNEGGHDNLTRALAGRFTDRVRLAFSKQARTGGYEEFAEPTELSFHPEGAQFLGRPVILLTSNNSVSAADIQAMVLKGLPDMRLVGETTYGAFSSTLLGFLPNGWPFTISNERYLSPETPPRDYELLGIAPDIPVLGSQATLDQGRDNILERALQVLREPACTPGATRLCLLGGRFEVTVDWRRTDGQSGAGRAIDVTDRAGLFYFFAPDNVEMLTKMLDACSLNGRFWLFYAATTDVEFTVRVFDTETGATWEHSNTLGSAAPPVLDTAAFTTCP